MTGSFVLPPKASKIVYQEVHHGICRDDSYHWLRASNWQDVFKKPSCLDANIQHHLEKENAYQAAQMADTKSLQDLLFTEMKGRIQENDSSVPIKMGFLLMGSLMLLEVNNHIIFVPQGMVERRTFILMVMLWLKVKNI